ncbi:MAG: 6-phosphofructokinase [Chloroflexi bacterium]|nr:6-phosphofructokinase [Chloroflexota bacterium]
MDRLAILTSGGDAPGMNAAIRAAVRSATTHGITMMASPNGFMGLVHGDFQELDDRAVGNQIQRGGTFIGTSRCPEFLHADVRAKAAENMRREGIEGLVVIGGDGSFRGACALAGEQGVAVAGIPGTIDNDVYGTDHTIGFDTAVNTAVLAIDQVRDTGESTGTTFFVEVMGRTSGAIALHTAVAAGATGVLVPEAHDDIEDLAQRIRKSIQSGKRSHIVVVAEGDHEGGAFRVAKKVSECYEHPYRVVVLGHIQRGGSPTALDRIVAAQSGALAVQALAAGRSGIMIGIQRGVPVEVLLSEVVAHSHPEARSDLLALAQQLAG